MTASITYAIPYYKGLAFLEKTIQSVIAQDNPHWKIVVLDDRGGEDAELLVQSFTDDRLTYVRNDKTLGLAANWNKAISLASTEFVTILHADDELLPNYTDVANRLMSEYPEATAVHCRTLIIDENGSTSWSLPDAIKKVIRPHSRKDIVTIGESGLWSLVKGQWIFCPTLCYRQTLFPSEGFSNDWMMVLDLELMSRILLTGGVIVGSPVVAYKYRRHSNNQTVKLTNSNQRFKEEIKLLDIISEQCRERDWHRAAKSAKRKTVIRFHLLYKSLQSVSTLKLSSAQRLFVGALTLRLE